MPRAVALIFPVLLAACAGTPRAESSPQSRRCEAASARVGFLLREGLESYLDGMRRYAAARDPQLSVEAAEERAKARSDAWMREHREALLRSCGEWSDDRYDCVMTSVNAAALKHCGLEDVVKSYTDEVVADHAAQPLDRPGTPGR